MVRGIEHGGEVDSGCGEWEWIPGIGRGTRIGICIRKGEIEYD